MTTKQLTDDIFLQQFEQLTLDPEHFCHQGHLRLVWLYLNHYDIGTAINRIGTNIKAYAESLGAHDKFNLTITDALARIAASRIKTKPCENWQSFLKLNPDLVDDALGLLLAHYNKSTLFSNDARVTVIAPDIKAIV